MTKIKNTKKGMAKKTLSISLAVAMLATSNVPVWAAEDLFTDGEVAVEAFSAEEAPVEEVEAPVVEESDDIAAVAETEVGISGKLANTNGWGFYPEIKDLKSTGLLENDQFTVTWKVNEKIVETYSGVQLSSFEANAAKATNREYWYIPKKEDCGKEVSVTLSRPEDPSDAKVFTSTMSTTVGKRDITGYTTITPQTTAPSYDGKAHNDATEWVKEAVFAGGELTYTKGELDITVNSDKNLVDADSDIFISVTPKDTTYYTGEHVVDLTAGINKIAWKDSNGEYLKAELIKSEYEYTGTAIKPEKEDAKITDTLADVVLDSETVIENIWTRGGAKVNAGTYAVGVSLKADKMTNFSSVPTADDPLAAGELTITKRDLKNTKITFDAIKAQNGQITDSQIKAAFDTGNVTDLEGNAILGLTTADFDVKNIEDNNGLPGYYTAKLVAKTTSTNFKGEKDITFRVYNMPLNAAFDGKLDDGTVYANAAEEYTGEAITKDPVKLGNLVLKGDTNPLTPGVSYDTKFEYASNVDAGTASFKVKGLNDYAGSEKTFEFKINAAKVTDDDISYNKKVVYVDDSSFKPEEYDLGLVVKAKNGATPAKEFTLEKGKDYTVTYSYEIDTNDIYKDGKNKYGDYVCAHIEIINDNFKGGKDEFNVYSEISKKQVSSLSIATVQSSYVYTGEAIVPELIVKDGDMELTEGYDYKIKSIANGTDVGTATVTIIGMNEYDDESEGTVKFEITPADTAKLVVSVDDQEYTGHKIKPTVSDMTVKLGDVVISDKFVLSYPVAKEANTAVGTGTVTLTPDRGNKNFTGAKEVTFNIVGQKITANPGDLKVYDNTGKLLSELPNFQYDGKAHTFADAEFVYWDKTNPAKPRQLVEGTDFEIKYFHNVYGDDDRTAYIAVVGLGNYAGDGKSYVFEDENGKTVNAIVAKEFNITPVILNVQNVTVANGEYAEGLPVKPVVTVTYGKDTLTLVEGEDYELVYPTQTEPTATAKYSVTVNGIHGYESSSDLKAETFKWGIDKKDLANCDIEAFQDEEGLHVVVMNGSVRVQSAKYVVTENTDGTVTVTPAKDSKYYTGSKTVTIGGEDVNAVPDTPMITEVNVVGNKATVVLSGDCDGAVGYDYVISTDRNCINNKNYDKVNKNKLTTETTFTYTQQGTYYAYCHAWRRDVNTGKKIFSGWSKAYPFMVTAITPDQPVITNVSVKGSTVTVTYTKAANATGYDVVLGSAMATVANEKRPVNYGTLVKKNIKANTVTATFTNVPEGTYYAGLHAFNRTSEDDKKVFSPWSNAKKVTVK